MKVMVNVSLLLNLAVLVPVCFSLITSASWVETAYGAASPARSILLAVYLAILIGSVVLLIQPVPEMVMALLLVQIVYKLISVITVGSLANPVVASNVAIAAVHAVTVFLIVNRSAA